MKFNIPEKCEIRWQAALAVLEDLQEDVKCPLDMVAWANEKTVWHGCGSPACFGGYIAVSPYCKKLGYPKDKQRNCVGDNAPNWLVGGNEEKHDGEWERMFTALFSPYLRQGTRAKTLAHLEETLKQIFKDSTGKTLKAPLTFYV